MIRIDHIEVGGWEPPHELKIEIIGTIDVPVGDDIVVAAHERGREFLKAVKPTIEEAFDRVFLKAAQPMKVEDIER